MTAWIKIKTSTITLTLFGYWLTASLSHAAEPAAGKLGLVKEKPASGRYVKTDQGYMIPYEATIPGTNVKYYMEPIPGGQGPVGSPANEAKRQAVEGPQYQPVQQP